MTTRTTPKIMKCGCAANAKTDRLHGIDFKPPRACCLFHMCIEEAEEQPSLEGRFARCSYFRTCKSQVKSDNNLAFFSHQPNKEYDDYYCGCNSWE